MSFQPGIQTANSLPTIQPVSSSIVPIDIGSTGVGNTAFIFNLGAGKRLYWELDGGFSLGATGGFRFLAHCTVAPTTYQAKFQVVDETTPATFQDEQIVEAAFTNASAVASNYLLTASGFILAAGATVFSLQFAQNNSTVNAINMLPGMVIKLWQL
jgi:hypothetical protein